MKVKRSDAIFCLTLLAFCLLQFSCAKKMYLEEWGMQTDGRIKTELCAFEISVIGDTIQKNKIRSKFVLLYNREGFPTEVWHFGKNETKVRIKEKFTYDKKNRTITYQSFVRDTVLEFKIVYNFNRKMQQTDYTYIYSDGTKGGRGEYFFESNGRDYTTNSYEETGELKNKSFTQKNKKGQIIKQVSYNTDGTISAYSNVLYDRNGREKEHIWYNADGSIQFGSTNIKYDFQGERTYSENATDHKINTVLIQRDGDSLRRVYFSDGKATGIEEAINSYR